MKTNSFFRHRRHTLTAVLLYMAIAIVGSSCHGCYSFTGGSVPPHLKTISIATTVDNSGFGTLAYRELVTQLLVDKFRNDNSLSVVDREGDARLSSVITSIREEPVSVRAGDVERERKVTVNIEVEYYDAVKKKQILKKVFSNAQVFSVANAATERDSAIRSAFQQIVNDILLAVVSGW